MLHPSSSTRRKGALRTEAPPRSPHNQISTPKKSKAQKTKCRSSRPKSQKTCMDRNEGKTDAIAHNGQLSPTPTMAAMSCSVYVRRQSRYGE
jgi:hypothetical protein